MRYAIVIERAEDNYSAYLPDVPGCVTTGATVAETIENMKEALCGHLQMLSNEGEPLPAAESVVDYVDIAAVALDSVRPQSV